jgi:hypothetical protein
MGHCLLFNCSNVTSARIAFLSVSCRRAVQNDFDNQTHAPYGNIRVRDNPLERIIGQSHLLKHAVHTIFGLAHPWLSLNSTNPLLGQQSDNLQGYVASPTAKVSNSISWIIPLLGNPRHAACHLGDYIIAASRICNSRASVDKS